jgi:hypothetical protein
MNYPLNCYAVPYQACISARLPVRRPSPAAKTTGMMLLRVRLPAAAGDSDSESGPGRSHMQKRKLPRNFATVAVPTVTSPFQVA